jgi:hypothetical protein
MGQNLTRIEISIEELIRFIMMLFISINYQFEKVTFFGSVFMRITHIILTNDSGTRCDQTILGSPCFQTSFSVFVQGLILIQPQTCSAASQQL